MGGSSTKLRKAKEIKNDEFYTPRIIIEDEVKHYQNHFKDKVVYCNCDDPEWSEFYKFFKLRMALYGIKKLISTHYVLPNTKGNAYKLECVVDENDAGLVIETRTLLEGNGDFRSPECVALLEQVDIVCTNPPFSLFREYVALLMKHNKKFLIIGNINALVCKEIYKLISNGKIWNGSGRINTPFALTKESLQSNSNNSASYKSVSATWFTNMEHAKNHTEIRLYADYDPIKYPKYDNYDAINVNRLAEIPKDYAGCMGVPITFLLHYNKKQFEIVGFRKGNDGRDLIINGYSPYIRVLVRQAVLNNRLLPLY